MTGCSPGVWKEKNIDLKMLQYGTLKTQVILKAFLTNHKEVVEVWKQAGRPALALSIDKHQIFSTLFF